MSTAPASSRSTVILLLIVTAVIVLSLAVCGGAIGWFAYTMSQARANMDSEVEALVAALASDDPAKFYRERTTPEFRHITKEDDFVRFAKLMTARLGKLQSKNARSFNAAQFNATSNVSVVYDAQFEHDKAELIVAWQRTGTGPWRVHTFRVNSMAMLEGATRVCPTCQAKAPVEAKFCPNCGAALEQAPLEPSPTPPDPPAEVPEPTAEETAEPAPDRG